MNSLTWYTLQLLLYFISSIVTVAQCTEEILLDGSESVKDAAIDTTGIWWAITQPFTNQERLVIDGMRTPTYDRVLPPVIAPDGKHWAAWISRGGMWMVLVDTIVLNIHCTSPGMILFAPNASVLALSWYDGNVEIIALGDRQYSPLRRLGKAVLSSDGSHLAWIEAIEQQQRLVVNGREVALGDAFIIGGFWHDGRLIYARRAGDQWRYYRGNEELGGPYYGVGTLIVNRFGTVAVAHVRQTQWHQVLLLSTHLNRPLPSAQYDSIWSLECHPYLAQYGALARRENTYFLIHSGAEYGVGRYGLAQLTFTADGAELYGFGCDVDCFFVLDGQRFGLGQDLDINLYLARRPGSQTFAYSTSTNLFVRRLDKPQFTFSRMCDAVLPVFYNRHRQRYEALGLIQGRLYRLSCF